MTSLLNVLLIVVASSIFADIVMHSATKFIAGHSDVMAGVLAVKGERLYLLQSYPNLPREGWFSCSCILLYT